MPDLDPLTEIEEVLYMVGNKNMSEYQVAPHYARMTVAVLESDDDWQNMVSEVNSDIKERWGLVGLQTVKEQAWERIQTPEDNA